VNKMTRESLAARIYIELIGTLAKRKSEAMGVGYRTTRNFLCKLRTCSLRS
jgi:hypothetical protein